MFPFAPADRGDDTYMYLDDAAGPIGGMAMGQGIQISIENGPLRSFKRYVMAEARRNSPVNKVGRGNASRLRRALSARNTRHVDWMG